MSAKSWENKVMSGNFGFTPGGSFDPLDPNNPLSPLNKLPMIATSALRDSARNYLASHSVIPVGTQDLDWVRESLDIANTWLDSATIFPSVSAPRDIAWSRRDWLDSTVSGWATTSRAARRRNGNSSL
jgi:hypothetical protein